MKLFKKWKRGFSWVLVGMLTIGLLAGCGGNAAPTEQGTNKSGATSGDKVVNMGYVNWAEGVAVTNLWKGILEQKGYEVNTTSLEAAPLYVGLSQGNLDIFMDSWLPITHETYWEKYKNDLDDYGIWYGEAKIGLVVPEYVDIDSIEDLTANKDKFGGKITGIDPGAGIMRATNTAVKSYGLDFEVIQSSEAAMITALDKAIRNNEWIVVTGWTPHWMFDKYDLKFIEDPKLSYGEAEQIHTLANKEFTKNNPEIAEMMKNFKLDDSQIGSLEALIKDGMEPQEAAKKWISENQALVDSWLK